MKSDILRLNYVPISKYNCVNEMIPFHAMQSAGRDDHANSFSH